MMAERWKKSIRPCWRWLPYEEREAAYHMAVDETLVGSIHSHDSPPTLRFYGWKRPALSLGRFQTITGGPFIGEEESRALLGSVDIIRRPTGGRAVWHGEELTYSLVLPEHHPGLPSSVAEITHFLSTGLAIGLTKLGIWVDVATSFPTRYKNPDQKRASACFATVAPGSLLIGRRKLGGNAQVRSHGIILQHGMIRLRHLPLAKPGQLGGIRPSHPWYRLVRQQTVSSIVLEELLPQIPPIEILYEELAKGLAASLHVEWHKGSLTPREKEMAAHLQAHVYQSAPWIWDRIRQEPFPCGL